VSLSRREQPRRVGALGRRRLGEPESSRTAAARWRAWAPRAGSTRVVANSRDPFGALGRRRLGEAEPPRVTTQKSRSRAHSKAWAELREFMRSGLMIAQRAARRRSLRRRGKPKTARSQRRILQLASTRQGSPSSPTGALGSLPSALASAGGAFVALRARAEITDAAPANPLAAAASARSRLSYFCGGP
jgi:hypothetical protein